MARKGLKALDKAFAKITDSDGDPIVVKASDASEWKFCPTDSPSFNAALGNFGLPLGCIITVGGPESSAKSSILLNVLGSVQRNISQSGKLDKDGDPITTANIALFDAERAWDSGWSSRMGLDIGQKKDKLGNWVSTGTDNFRLIQTSEAEPALEALEKAVDSGEYDCILLDSVNALNPLADSVETASLEDAKMALQARLMSRHLRRITNKARKRECTLIYISQLRSNMEKYQTFVQQLAAGSALRFFSSIIIKVQRTEYIGSKNADEAEGIVSKVTCVKNKIAKPGKSASFSLYFEGPDAFDYDMDYVDTAIALTEESKDNKDIPDIYLIKKAGAWLTLLDDKGEPIFVTDSAKPAVQGKKPFLEALKAKNYIPILKDRIVEAQKSVPDEVMEEEPKTIEE